MNSDELLYCGERLEQVKPSQPMMSSQTFMSSLKRAPSVILTEWMETNPSSSMTLQEESNSDSSFSYFTTTHSESTNEEDSPGGTRSTSSSQATSPQMNGTGMSVPSIYEHFEEGSMESFIARELLANPEKYQDYQDDFGDYVITNNPWNESYWNQKEEEAPLVYSNDHHLTDDDYIRWIEDPFDEDE